MPSKLDAKYKFSDVISHINFKGSINLIGWTANAAPTSYDIDETKPE